MQTLATPSLRKLVLAALTGTALLPGAVLAQASYPSKPITIVVPYPAGGSNDTFARQVAKELGEQLTHQSVS